MYTEKFDWDVTMTGICTVCKKEIDGMFDHHVLLDSWTDETFGRPFNFFEFHEHCFEEVFFNFKETSKRVTRLKHECVFCYLDLSLYGQGREHATKFTCTYTDTKPPCIYACWECMREWAGTDSIAELSNYLKQLTNPS